MDPPAERPSVDPEIGALVVIAEEADLLASPNEAALRFAVPLNRATDPTSGHVAQVVAIEGDLIGVRTVDGALARQCAGSFGIEAALELRFWVMRGSLRTVLNRAARVDYEDGSSVALAPGVPLSRFEDRISAHVGGLKLPIDLPDDALGSSFTPAAPATDQPSAWDTGTIPWPAMAELRYGEQVVKSRGGVFTRALAQRDLDVGDAVLLSFANPCGRFELLGQPGDRLNDDALERPEPEPLDLAKARWAAGISPLQADTPEDPCARWELAANTPLTWTDGSDAGRTRGLFTLSRAPIMQKNDQRACFDAVPGFAVCSEAAAVTRRVEPSCE